MTQASVSGATVTDASGNGNAGTVMNGPLAFGVMGANFTGQQYVSSTLTVTSSALTVSVWFNAASLSNANPRLVANSHTDADAKGFQLMFNSGGASGFFDVGNGTSVGQAGWNQQLVAGTWYHYVGVYNGATVSAYLNGVQVASAAFAGGAIAAGTGPGINIARNPTYGSDFFDGAIYDVRIYERALSVAEILALYQAITPPPSSPLAIGVYQIAVSGTAMNAGNAAYNNGLVGTAAPNPGSGAMWYWNGATLACCGAPNSGGSTPLSGPYLTDSGSGLAILNNNQDTWSISGGGTSFTFKNNRTGNYLTLSGTTLSMSATQTVWTVTAFPSASIAYPGEWAGVETTDGMWVLTGVANSGGDYPLALNASLANGGAAIQIQIANRTIYAYSKASKTWSIWQNEAWLKLTANSPDGLSIKAGPAADYPNGNPFFLTTSEGTWTWGGTATSTGDYPTQLNGTANGDAVQMQITNGILYALNAVGNWYARNNGNWVLIGTTAPVEGATPTPTAITLSPASVTIPDNAPAGTLLATAAVTMSDGSQFTGTLTTSNTSFFAISGLNIVTAKALTLANDGTQSTVITASQGSQSASMELSM